MLVSKYITLDPIAWFVPNLCLVGGLAFFVDRYRPLWKALFAGAFLGYLLSWAVMIVIGAFFPRESSPNMVFDQFVAEAVFAIVFVLLLRLGDVFTRTEVRAA